MAETPDPVKILHDVKGRTRAHLEDAKRATEGENPPGRNFLTLRSGTETYDMLFRRDGGIIAYINQRLAHSDTGKPLRILDYGSGANKLGRDLSSAFGSKITFTGISAGDPRSTEEKDTDQKNRVGFKEQSLVSLPATDEMDLIVSSTTFVHLPDPLRTLKQLYSRLATGGELRAECCLGDLVEAFDRSDNLDAESDAETAIIRLQKLGIDIQMDTERTIIRKNSPGELPIEKVFWYSGINTHPRGRLHYTLKPD